MKRGLTARDVLNLSIGQRKLGSELYAMRLLALFVAVALIAYVALHLLGMSPADSLELIKYLGGLVVIGLASLNGIHMAGNAYEWRAREKGAGPGGRKESP